jgi:hypothetical protein
MGDTFGDPGTGPGTPADEDPNPPYDPPTGHTWTTWQN